MKAQLIQGVLWGLCTAAAWAQVPAKVATGATGAAPAAAPAVGHPADPLEGFNRAMFTFNGAIDYAVIQPVAVAYETVVPRVARQGVGNFFGNLSDAWSAVNLVLQGKPALAWDMTVRVALNTVFGFAGVLDLATEAGVDRQTEDFGQTLATWGVGSGPYLVLPIFGPSTLRDAAALPLDRAVLATAQPTGEAERWRWLGVQLTHSRAEALPFTRMLDTIALDKYTFVRDAYLTRRRSQIYDGNPPPEPEDSQP